MKRPAFIIGAAVTCVVAFVVYFATRPPQGVAPMGDEPSVTIAWISLAIGIVSLATTAVAFIQKLIELRAANRG